MASHQQPLDYKPNALPTVLRQLMCRVGFKLLLFLYSAIKATILHVIASCMHNTFI